MTVRNILVCTVGGSHQPIVTAINSLAPDLTIFCCSGRDPGTGKPGSDVQIMGQGKVIKARPGDEKPTLPNIPAQAGLPEDSFEVVIIPADDLDEAVEIIRQKLADLTHRFPATGIVADYTGGTKSMTAALVIAALETNDIGLQLVTGNRADLVKVRNGTESAAPANIESIRLIRAMRPYLSAWQRHAYDEAADGLSGIRTPGNTLLRNRLNRARDISKAFAAWDRFDHREALRLLEIYQPVIGKDLGRYFATLRLLVEKNEPALLLDLWRNAERRAVQGRYDDAVARCYRMVEWTAQWLLHTRCGIDTSDIAPAQLPDDFDLSKGHADKIQAGLFKAWELVGIKLPGSAAGKFAANRLPTMLDHIQVRNNSILAHGKTPVGRENWQKFHLWLDQTFLPMLCEEMKQVRISKMAQQLPDRYLWEDS
ncbi:CRISPR-associated protein [bacterium BMS3Abin13]|nr:CRISPR-associated protein [bacterium BMS3Abin13]